MSLHDMPNVTGKLLLPVPGQDRDLEHFCHFTHGEVGRNNGSNTGMWGVRGLAQPLMRPSSSARPSLVYHLLITVASDD